MTTISGLLALPGLDVLSAPAQAVKGLMGLLERYPVAGSRVFDLQIAATMQADNIHRIYTFNTGDFQRFSGVEVITP